MFLLLFFSISLHQTLPLYVLPNSDPRFSCLLDLRAVPTESGFLILQKGDKTIESLPFNKKIKQFFYFNNLSPDEHYEITVTSKKEEIFKRYFKTFPHSSALLLISPSKIDLSELKKIEKEISSPIAGLVGFSLTPLLNKYIIPIKSKEALPFGLSENYSFSYQSVHFVILTNPNDWEWLENNLQKHKEKTVIIFQTFPVYYHQDSIIYPFSKAYQRLIGLYETYQVKVVISFAGYFYQRTYPITPSFSESWGLVYTGEKHFYGKDCLGTIFINLPTTNLVIEEGVFQNQNYYFINNLVNPYFLTLKIDESSIKFMGWERKKDDGKLLAVDSFIISFTDTLLKTPEIRNVRVSRVLGFSCEIEWETDVLATSQIEYGEERNKYTYLYPPNLANQNFNKKHRIKLFGLKPATNYYYRVRSRSGHKIAVSKEYRFMTLPPAERETIIHLKFSLPYLRIENGLGVFPDEVGIAYSSQKISPFRWNEPVFFSLNETPYHFVPNSQIRQLKFPLPSGRYFYQIKSPLYAKKKSLTETKIILEDEKVLTNDTLFSGLIDIFDGDFDLKIGLLDSAKIEDTVLTYSTISELLLLATSPPVKRNEVTIYPPSPNPFTDKVTFLYSLNRSQTVKIEIYDALGKRVLTLKDRLVPAGYNFIAWDGRDLEDKKVKPGIYFIKIFGRGFERKEVKVTFLGK